MAPMPSLNYIDLRHYVQLFNDYGNSMIDYNRKLSVLSVGLTLVDW
jgi:phospholipase A1